MFTFGAVRVVEFAWRECVALANPSRPSRACTDLMLGTIAEGADSDEAKPLPYQIAVDATT